jgi:cob(I)alamin adenosyltransferase
VIKLYRAETLIPRHIHYLNRLSDLLFVLCRILNREHGIDDVMWQPGKNRGIEAA